jgi:hypothetical protein
MQRALILLPGLLKVTSNVLPGESNPESNNYEPSLALPAVAVAE